jgi:GT2 family glycosyltransferase
LVTVVVPTHNRSTSLRRLLDALSRQTYPASSLQVVVVADGCSDGTADMLQAYAARFELQVLEQTCLGPAAARNHGAARAQGQQIVFLDDDIEPLPGLIDAHVRVHNGQADRVVIGYLPPVTSGGTGFFPLQLRDWWEAMFERLRQPGHRATYRDLLSGNLSLSVELFARVGGFDPALRCHEDYELGARLIDAGARFVFAPDAAGYHHETADLAASLRRKRAEGRADVTIARRRPELALSTPLAGWDHPWSPMVRRLRRLAFARPARGDRLAALLQRSLDWLESMRMRGRWRSRLVELLDYWYWRGAAEAIGTPQGVADLLQRATVAGSSQLEAEIDLAQGLEAAEQALDALRPAGVRLVYRGRPIGRVPAAPGSEPLRGVHLRPILATVVSPSLIDALFPKAISGGPVEPAALVALFHPRPGRLVAPVDALEHPR